MPKMPKATTPSRTRAASERIHNPLADDLLAAGHLRTKSSKRKSRGDEDDTDPYIDAKASRKILQISQSLADEDAEETRAQRAAQAVKPNTAFEIESRFQLREDDDNVDPEDYDAEEQWGDDDEDVEEVVCNAPAHGFRAMQTDSSTNFHDVLLISKYRSLIPMI